MNQILGESSFLVTQVRRDVEVRLLNVPQGPKGSAKTGVRKWLQIQIRNIGICPKRRSVIVHHEI